MKDLEIDSRRERSRLLFFRQSQEGGISRDQDKAKTTRQAMETGARALTSDPQSALVQARRIIGFDPTSVDGHRLLALAYRKLGQIAHADEADRAAIAVSSQHRQLADAARLLRAGRFEETEVRLRAHLREDPIDAGALRMLAEVAGHFGYLPDAEKTLRRALQIAPGYVEARVDLAKLVYRQNRMDETFGLLAQVLEQAPDHLMALAFKAATLVTLRRLEEADAVFRQMLRAHPRDGRGWMNYAHLLKTRGQIDDAIRAYRRSVEVEPSRGIAWWGLANLKSVTLDADDIAAMRAALALADEDEDRVHIEFALGKALGDQRAYAESFEHYREGNRLRLAGAPHDPDKLSAEVDRVIDTLSSPFLALRSGRGDPATDPIFIVSMPRSGSTLIEQILASHSMIEGTEELYDLERIALDLAPGGPAGSYLNGLSDRTATQLRDLGRHYIESTRRHRRTDRPFFTDKMPSNWVFTGLIHLILPNAKIVDVRRHPMACGFANFAQHYNWGINFAYDLTHIGRFYRDYVRQMAHFDQVSPGLVHRVIHEELVGNLEGEVRRLLDYLGLPFEEGCLRFHETDRAVHTPSSEQVRQPVNRRGFDTWRNYEPWLGPLKESLGEVLENYGARARD
ncbi:sulfotransferase [Sphingomonas sp. HF-S3]|uniref:Sulfotransferase n=1 Tax=Sphingomonas rustica TaxID=3103142 RepID=A0ABV0B7J4_9SPHN